MYVVQGKLFIHNYLSKRKWILNNTVRDLDLQKQKQYYYNLYFLFSS